MLWLTKDLQQKIKDKFEPFYGQELSDAEVIEIANNLVSVVEIWKERCQKQSSKPKT